MLKLIRQLAVLSALTSYSFFTGTSSVKAQSMPVCPASGTVANLLATTACRGTPNRYEIIIYEMGLCTADPLGSGTFVRTTCSATFTGPTTADLAGGASVSLGSSGSRPADGSYSHAYIVLGNTFGLSGEYELSAGSLAGTYRSDSNGTAVLNGALTNFTETLDNFDTGNPCSPIASDSVGGGTLTAVVADTTLVTASSCTGVSRIVASFAPSSSIVIDSAATGLKVTFSVTDNGMTVMDGANGVVTHFTSGPFSPTFTILN
jgi:hypothetical protein